MMAGYDLIEVLEGMDPASLEYADWVLVGMALKQEGFPCDVWDSWSRRDSRRYHEGDCERKWASFNGGSGIPVAAGSIVEIARRQGWQTGYTAELMTTEDPWCPVITMDTQDDGWLIAPVDAYRDLKPLRSKGAGNSVKEIATYLEALFDPDEYVNIVAQSYLRDGKYLPSSKGIYSKTAGELLEGLAQCHGDIGGVFGDYDRQAGVWVRINPLDGQGVKNTNVTDFRYCLVESDTMPIDEQNRILRALELPIAALVHSGGKSLHAIVHVDAQDRKQYDERVRIILKACRDNGLDVDEQNKNPARLSRLPGVTRGTQRQYLVATSIGRADYADWIAWRHEQTDGLPDAISFEAEMDEEGTEPEILIEGMLATGEKMLLAGPSKAGKSYALMELCVAFAEGTPWMGRACQTLDVLYINLELKADSRRRRMQEIYAALGIVPKGATRIHSMDLRGKNVTLASLTAKLVSQAITARCKVIIIDPIYKVLDGDENSSEDVSRFCVALDYLIEKLGVSVIYCHHYSKGAANYTSSMNRASGSSVFSRDADALITLDELELDTQRRKSRFQSVACELITGYLEGHIDGWKERLISEDDIVVLDALRPQAVTLLGAGSVRANTLVEELNALEDACMTSLSAWRIEGTLRDFPRFAPIDVYYQWPLHTLDDCGALRDIKTASTHQNGWGKTTKKESAESRKEANAKERQELLKDAYESFKEDDQEAPISVKDLADYLLVTEKTIRKYVKDSDEYACRNGTVIDENREKREK